MENDTKGDVRGGNKRDKGQEEWEEGHTDEGYCNVQAHGIGEKSEALLWGTRKQKQERWNRCNQDSRSKTMPAFTKN